MDRGRLLRGLALAAVWLVVTLATGLAIFLGSSRTVVLASHEAVLRPTLDGYVFLRTGPVLPDLRLPSGHRVGADIILGKTEADTTEQLVQRYGYIASQPDGQIAKVQGSLEDMAFDAAVRGAVVGLLPVVVWLLVGPARRRELAHHHGRAGVVIGVTLVVIGVLIWSPWSAEEPIGDDAGEWTTLPDYLGPDINVPEEAAGVEVRTDVTTAGGRRLIQSAVDTYDKSRQFYEAAADRAENLDLRKPEPGDTVVVLIADRHDNIGMDGVARAIADAGGATAVFDAGDDTSTGQSWEAFSLDSVTNAFEGFDRFAVAGNHDHGSFVTDYLDDLGWKMLDGEVIDGPGGATLLGVDDPRSSRLADAACDSEDRIATILVHDANLADEALERGCADLVLGGHLHVEVGPSRVLGTDGQRGYSFTTGTTGGAAFAIALGSKPRREASVTLVTYRDGRPAGLQPVVLQTNGTFEVENYQELRYD
jgi:predicted phosphodiesterase